MVSILQIAMRSDKILHDYYQKINFDSSLCQDCELWIHMTQVFTRVQKSAQKSDLDHWARQGCRKSFFWALFCTLAKNWSNEFTIHNLGKELSQNLFINNSHEEYCRYLLTNMLGIKELSKHLKNINQLCFLITWGSPFHCTWPRFMLALHFGFLPPRCLCWGFTDEGKDSVECIGILESWRGASGWWEEQLGHRSNYGMLEEKVGGERSN